MAEGYIENKARLLRMLYALYSGEVNPPLDLLPFTVDAAGAVSLNDVLLAKLGECNDIQFSVWVRDNIASLV